ncbi:hypothetical protein QA644_30150 (plasmid) [Rhizobium sp. CC1099]|uniref:hypothetical protein n=1 Tax=Rhizobium sp. CC1099 TaxID=3039160 RepID=UPI0024B253BE|nr:hypothetical protein [Rhizobium sp. CC1099]WFU90255.1 hypothetical protein QA644_30150 [Rhizobium sp. CC1099]
MKMINDWLADKVQESVALPLLENCSAGFEQEVDMLRDQALAEEYSIQNLTATCGGEIDVYLKERQNAGIRQESEKDL